MEENNISINDKGLEAISAGGAPLLDESIDFASISFDEFLTEINFPSRESFPLGAYDSTILTYKGLFEQLKTVALCLNQPKPGLRE